MSFVTLQFSDHRPTLHGLADVNDVLHTVGVHASTTDIPADARPILEASRTRPTTPDEQEQLLEIFALDRAALLAQVALAGRTPTMVDGGHLTPREGTTDPYPKVYDTIALDDTSKAAVLGRYGRLHVNTTDDGTGIDEVMTVVSGGPFTWMYLLPDGVLVRLTVHAIDPAGPAVRLSYPGIRMHAGYMDPDHGIIIAHAHGPESFTIRFDDAPVPYAHLLNTNAWVDFTGTMPSLRDSVTASDETPADPTAGEDS